MAITMSVRHETEEKREFDGHILNLETTYNGAVLATYEQNGYNDSDFFAVVYDRADSEVKTIEYGTTRFWTYANGANTDATEEIQELAKKWAFKKATEKAENHNQIQSLALIKGRRVVVIAGRKVKKGLTGTILSITPNPYTAPRYGQRGKSLNANVCLKLDTGEIVYTYSQNLNVIEPYLLDAEYKEQLILNMVASFMLSYRTDSFNLLAGNDWYFGEGQSFSGFKFEA